MPWPSYGDGYGLAATEFGANAFSIEIEFTPGVWTDVTGDTASIDTIKRGKNHELSRTERGQCSLLLRNGLRQYDPDNNDGPYFGDLLPMKRIRIRSLWNAVTYDNFFGFIKGFPQSWQDGLFQQVDLVAEDAFSVLARAKVAGTRYTHQLYTDTVDDAVIGASAAHYYFSEAPGATSAVDRLVGFDLSTVGTNVTLGAPERPPTYGRPYSVAFGPVNDAGNGLSRTTGPATGAMPQVLTWACWLRLDTLSTDGYVVGLQAAGSTTLIWHMNSSGAATVTWDRTGGAPFALDATLASVFVADGEWHHYAVRITITGGTVGVGGLGVVFIKDGATLNSDSELATGSENITGVSTISNLFVGGDGGLGGSHGLDGNMAQLLLVLDNAPSSSQLQELGTPVFDYIPEEPAGLQIHSILDGIGWPVADRDLDDGTVDMEGIQFQPGDELLDTLMQIAEDSERGLFFPGPDGILYFKDAATLAALTQVADFENSVTGIKYVNVETRFDDQDIWNQVAIEGGGQTSYEEDVVSADLVTGYGPRLLQITTSLADTADADALAATLVAQYKDPHTRPVQMTLYAIDDTTILEQILGLGQGDRVGVTIQPPAGGDDIVLDAMVEGLTLSVPEGDIGVRAVLDLVPLGAPDVSGGPGSFGFFGTTFGEGTFGG